MLIFSKTFIKISVKFVIFIKSIIIKTLSIILFPFKRIYMILKTVFIVMNKFLKGKSKTLSKNVIKYFKIKIVSSIRRILYKNVE